MTIVATSPGIARPQERSLSEIHEGILHAETSIARLATALDGALQEDRRDVINAFAASRFLEHLYWEWRQTDSARHPKLHARWIQALAFTARQMPRLRLVLGTGDRPAAREVMHTVQRVGERMCSLARETERLQIIERRSTFSEGTGESAAR